MDSKSLLHALSPQLQALVEASLGEKLPGRASAQQQAPAESNAAALALNQFQRQQEQPRLEVPPATATSRTSLSASRPAASAPTSSTAAAATSPTPTSVVTSSPAVKLNPSELFVLQHPESPGFVVKECFLGRDSASKARDALVALAQTETLRDARVGHGEQVRSERTVRGDRILWLKRPRDLSAGPSDPNALDPAIVHLLKRVETLVFGVKAVLAPALDVRNVTSTQLAIFPGDGSRFVRHTDTYSSTHADDGAAASTGASDFVRLVTCVYYLNPDWEPAHAGQLRVYVRGASSSGPQHWDVAPALDTLVVFRSLDVEHEVLPTLHDRMALTIWYYGRATRTREPRVSTPAALDLVKNVLQFTPPPEPAPRTAPGAPLPLALSAPDASPSDTIFVAIPSYRDPECRHTVDDLLAKASDPSRIRIGICLQLGDGDDDPRSYFAATYASAQIRITAVDYRDAAGPCVARAEAQKLYDSEAYYLQIDSHMRFRENWDAYLLQELRKCPSAKPILTTYPLGYTLPNDISTDVRPTLLCAGTFDANGILRQVSKTLAARSSTPIASRFWAAGFAFSSASVIQDVPYDETLRFLFFGEEASMSARLWTSGYDFFAPSESVVYHLWTRAYRRVFHELEDDATRTWRTASQRYVQTLLVPSAAAGDARGADTSASTKCVSAGTFALGTVRSLAAYETYIGVDFAAQDVQWTAQWGHLDPMHFELSSSAAAHAPA